MTIFEIEHCFNTIKLQLEKHRLLEELGKHAPLMAEVEKDALAIEASDLDDAEKDCRYKALIPKVNRYHEATADISAALRAIDARLVFLEELNES